MSKWFITDDDCLQCCKPVPSADDNCFEFVQVSSWPNNTIDNFTSSHYEVMTGTINIKDFTETEINEVLSLYGYEDMDDFVLQNCPDPDLIMRSDASIDRDSEHYVINYQLIAEMLFELECNEMLGTKADSWNEAVRLVGEITGLDLTAYKETETRSILMVIEKENGSEKNYLTTPEEFFKQSEYTLSESSVSASGFKELFSPQKPEHRISIKEVPLGENSFRAASTLSRFLDGEWNDNRCVLLPWNNPPIPSLWKNAPEKVSPGAKALLPHLLNPVLSEISGKDHNQRFVIAVDWQETHSKYTEHLDHIFSSLNLLDVKRHRSSITQGAAGVICNGKEIVRYPDEICLRKKNGKLSNGFTEIEGPLYGEVIDNWGSSRPDSTFRKAALLQYTEEIAMALTPAKSLEQLIEDASMRQQLTQYQEVGSKER